MQASPENEAIKKQLNSLKAQKIVGKLSKLAKSFDVHVH